MKSFFLLPIFIIFIACSLTTTRPKEEMSLATAAFLAAREANAHISAPNLFRKAEYYFGRAKSAYRKKYFDKAKQYSLLTKKFAEKAEFLALRKAVLENM